MWRTVCWLAILTSGLEAAPTVALQARTRLELQSMTPTERGVQVRGRIIDASTGEGLGHAPIKVESRGHAQRVESDADGSFVTLLPTQTLGHTISAYFEARAGYAGTHVAKYAEVGKASLALALTADLQGEAVVLRLASRTPLDAPVAVSLTATTPNASKALSLIKLENGPQSIRMDQSQLGLWGVVTFVANFPGDEQLQPTNASTQLTLYKQLTMVAACHARTPTIATCTGELKGVLPAPNGPPTGIAISAWNGEVRLATAVAAPAFQLSVTITGAWPSQLELRTEPTGYYAGQVTRIPLAPAAPPGASALMQVMVAATGALALWGLLRRRARTAYTARPNAKRQGTANSPPPLRRRRGVREAQIATVQVVDEASARGCPHATLRIVHGGHTQLITTDSTGYAELPADLDVFQIEGTRSTKNKRERVAVARSEAEREPVPVEISVTMEGYQPDLVRLTPPLQPSLTLRVRSWKEALFLRYMELLDAKALRPRAWNRLSPRQALQATIGSQQGPYLTLLAFVEEAYFGGRALDQQDLERLNQLAKGLPQPLPHAPSSTNTSPPAPP